MAFFVDTILVSHFLGEDSVAAVALGLPIIGLILAVSSMIIQGSFLKMLECMGKSDMKSYRRIYSISRV